MSMEKLRETPTFGRLIMKVEADAREAGWEEGKILGERMVIRVMVQILIKEKYSMKQISQITGLEIKEIEEFGSFVENENEK